MIEIRLEAENAYPNPFLDQNLEVRLVGPGGETRSHRGFFDGDGVWKIRFSPDVAGEWTVRTDPHPYDAGLAHESTHTCETPTFKPTGREDFGLRWPNGEPLFVVGDTTYHLFGWEHCGIDPRPFLRRRKEQGYDFLRARCQVSPYHPPDTCASAWQTESTWMWGGSPQAPDLKRFDLNWMRTMDRVVEECAALGLGLELIAQAWGFEFPFNDRSQFLPEWEELLHEYLVARYDAYPSVWFWTLMNEYEFYPDGAPRQRSSCDAWAVRMGRWWQRNTPHGTLFAIHNTGPITPFQDRLARDPDSVDLLMLQTWGDVSEERGHLAGGIEDALNKATDRWHGAAIFSEYGYEHSPHLELAFPEHRYVGADHLRTAAWRGVLSGMGGVVGGFEETWGPYAVLDRDTPGVEQTAMVGKIFRALQSGLAKIETRRKIGDALALDFERGTLLYFPEGGQAEIPGSKADWIDPKTGERREVEFEKTLVAPSDSDWLAWLS